MSGNRLLVVAALTLACNGPTGAPGPVPRPRLLTSAGQITAAQLEQWLPPPPPDAQPFEIREPLRNGRAVPLKKRWIWIPANSRIRLQPLGNRVMLELPVGTLLWKEFYLGTSAGQHLVERRILRKVPSGNRDNGWLLNGGWMFYTAHHLPGRADGVTGFADNLDVALTTPGSDRFMLRPDAWLPTRVKSAATFVDFRDDHGARFPYVFPGKTNCEVCHGGAAGAYANTEPRPVLAFGPHPTNLTTDSLAALVRRGWIDAPARLLAPGHRAADTTPTDRLVAVMRNNCLSCHNPSSRAAAQQTAFVLHPDRAYTPAQLHRLLSVRSTVMGSLGLPIVSATAPGASELVLRLSGARDRRRMPPAEGGLPEPDRDLEAQVREWIAALDAD